MKRVIITSLAVIFLGVGCNACMALFGDTEGELPDESEEAPLSAWRVYTDPPTTTTATSVIFNR